MIRSMTGFGSSEYSGNGTNISIEVRSVNGRFFDLRTKMPKSFLCHEGELRKIAQSYIERGRVTISISLDITGARAEEMSVDYDLADRYISLAGEMSSRYGIDNNMDSRTLMCLPEIIQWEENGFNNGKLWETVKKTAAEAFEAHRVMREKEGTSIEKDMKARLAVINGFAEEVENRAPEVVKANTVRLRKKIENLIGSSAVDENRFLMEMSLYAERVDITEECVRLRSHCEQFAHEISGDKASGRKLTFLLQEMNREANTIGSKVMNAKISQTVVRIKEELEKMREQAENME